ncbi:hypothetical protein Droror1_Dr00015751 [Drosera rotundifolia]
MLPESSLGSGYGRIWFVGGGTWRSKVVVCGESEIQFRALGVSGSGDRIRSPMKSGDGTRLVARGGGVCELQLGKGKGGGRRCWSLVMALVTDWW